MNLVHLDIILFSVWLVIFGGYELIMRNRDKYKKFQAHGVFFTIILVLFLSCYYHSIWLFLALVLIWRFPLPKWIAMLLAAPGMLLTLLVFIRYWTGHVKKLASSSLERNNYWRIF